MASRWKAANTSSWTGCSKALARWKGLPPRLWASVFQRSKTTARIIPAPAPGSLPRALARLEGQRHIEAEHIQVRRPVQGPGGGLMVQRRGADRSPGLLHLRVGEAHMGVQRAAPVGGDVHPLRE